jgi:hypothetical protein
MSLETDKHEGLAAANLKNDPAFVASIRLAREKIVQQWVAAPTPEEREALWHQWHAVTRLVDGLDVVEGRGHMAQAALKQHADPAKRSA